MADETPFLNRWSRLKQEGEPDASRKEASGTTPPAPLQGAAPPEDTTETEAPDDADPERDLPSLDSLTKESDYTGFLNPKVSDTTRNAALRKLWTSDPVFAVRDGLNDHDEDYTAPAIVGSAVRSAWNAVSGYLSAEPETTDAKEEKTPETQYAEANKFNNNKQKDKTLENCNKLDSAPENVEADTTEVPGKQI